MPRNYTQKLCYFANAQDLITRGEVTLIDNIPVDYLTIPYKADVDKNGNPCFRVLLGWATVPVNVQSFENGRILIPSEKWKDY